MRIRPALVPLLLATASLAAPARADEDAVDLHLAEAESLAEPDVGGLFEIDRNLPAIESSLARADSVFDAALAEAILGEMMARPGTKPLPGKPAPGYRLGAALADRFDSGPGWAALGGARIDNGTVALDWRQQLSRSTLDSRIGVHRADGAVEVHFDLETRVPLAAPTQASFGYDTSAYLRVLPALRIGAAARGSLDSLAALRPGQAIGPEARLSLPGLGGAFNAEAGWRMPLHDGAGGIGGQPGTVRLNLSFRKPL